jgi:hypothetical protein
MEETSLNFIKNKKFLLALIFCITNLLLKQAYKSWGVTRAQQPAPSWPRPQAEPAFPRHHTRAKGRRTHTGAPPASTPAEAPPPCEVLPLVRSAPDRHLWSGGGHCHRGKGQRQLRWRRGNRERRLRQLGISPLGRPRWTTRGVLLATPQNYFLL